LPAQDRDADSGVPDNPQVVVPEALMRQNLVSSRVPVIPDSAASHGIVVLDAVVTSRGTVEHLRAIQGDPSLRRAAIEAASTWRYRPYLLNGTPVDVSTTISVDFSGDE
jgi:protein TonB